MLAEAIENGVSSLTWEQDTFGYADAWDDKANRCVGLVTGGHAKVLVDDASVVVTPEAARRQLDEAPTPAAEPTTANGPTPSPGAGSSPGPLPVAKLIRRFYGTKSLDPQRVSRDADQIANEVVKHLVSLVDAGVDVKLEISADVPSGVLDDVVRTVTENAKTLKFEQHGFEED